MNVWWFLYSVTELLGMMGAMLGLMLQNLYDGWVITYPEYLLVTYHRTVKAIAWFMLSYPSFIIARRLIPGIQLVPGGKSLWGWRLSVAAVGAVIMTA